MTPQISRTWFYTTVLIVLLAMTVMAVPPTEEAVARWKAEGTFDQKMANLKEFRDLGGDAPSEHSPLIALREARSLSLNTDAVDTSAFTTAYTDWETDGNPIVSVSNSVLTKKTLVPPPLHRATRVFLPLLSWNLRKIHDLMSGISTSAPG